MKIAVTVKTGASHPVVFQEKDGFLVHVKAMPEKGKANKEIVRLLAKYFKVPQKNIQLTRGQTAKRKIFDVIDR